MTMQMILVLCLTLIYAQVSHQKLAETYNECSHNKTRCFGLPHECESTKTCVLLLSAKPKSNGADFELFWKYDPKSANRWAGAGLSTDNAMGDDSVTECIIWKNNTVTARQGLTHSGVSEEDYGVNTVAHVDGVTNQKGSFSEGIVSCSWSRAFDTHVKNLDFNIRDKKYFVLMAYGPINGAELEGHGKNNYYSLQSVFLAKPIQ